MDDRNCSYALKYYIVVGGTLAFACNQSWKIANQMLCKFNFRFLQTVDEKTDGEKKSWKSIRQKVWWHLCTAYILTVSKTNHHRIRWPCGPIMTSQEFLESLSKQSLALHMKANWRERERFLYFCTTTRNIRRSAAESLSDTIAKWGKI